MAINESDTAKETFEKMKNRKNSWRDFSCYRRVRESFIKIKIINYVRIMINC